MRCSRARGDSKMLHFSIFRLRIHDNKITQASLNVYIHTHAPQIVRCIHKLDFTSTLCVSIFFLSSFYSCWVYRSAYSSIHCNTFGTNTRAHAECIALISHCTHTVFYTKNHFSVSNFQIVNKIYTDIYIYSTIAKTYNECFSMCIVLRPSHNKRIKCTIFAMLLHIGWYCHSDVLLLQ